MGRQGPCTHLDSIQHVCGMAQYCHLHVAVPAAAAFKGCLGWAESPDHSEDAVRRHGVAMQLVGLVDACAGVAAHVCVVGDVPAGDHT